MSQRQPHVHRNRFFARLAGQNYFIKLLCSYLALILLCVSGMGFVLYNIVQNTVKEASIKENDRVLFQFKNTIDNLVFNKINDLSIRMLEDTFSNKTITYYFTEDMNQNIYDMSSVLKYCKTIKTLNPMLLSAGFYFEKNQLYICSDGVEAPGYGYRDNANLLDNCKKLIEHSNQNTYWCVMKQWNPVDSEQSEILEFQNVIYLVRKIEHLGGYGGAVILALDENTFYQSIQQASPDSLDSLVICDDTGMIVSYTDKTFLGKNISALSDQLSNLDQKNNSVISIHGVPSLCSFSRSAYSNWKYITFTSLNSIGMAGEKLTHTILIIALCTLLSGALLSLIPTSILSSPIRALEALCRRMNRRKKVEASHTPLNLNTLSEEISNQMTRLKEITPLVQDMLLSDLLFSSQWNTQEMIDQMHLIEFEFPFSKFCVIGIQPNCTDMTKEKFFDKWKELICETMHRTFESNHVLLFDIPRKDTCFFLLNFDFDFSQIKSLLLLWQKENSQIAQITVGETVESIKKISVSCEQASLGLPYFFLFSDRKILFFSDYGPLERSGQEPNIQLIQQLRDAFASLNLEKVLKTFTQIMDELRSMHYSFTTINISLQHCASAFINASQKMAIKDAGVLMDQAIQAPCLNKFEYLYRNAINIFFETMDLKRTAANHEQVKYAEAYIQKNIRNRDLSLQLVADYLKMSPSHLSKIFKTELGVTFIDYVIQFRLNECKNLLLNSSMRIEEISETMGYSTPQYFISRFKAAYGVTPKEFRSNTYRSNLQYITKIE